MSNIASTSKSLTTRSSLGSLSTIDLIGRTSHQITGAKLPSNRQVLKVFFHNIRFVKLSSIDSARLAIKSAQVFWEQARIPTKYEARSVDKLLKIYDTWKKIQRTIPEKRVGATKKFQDDFVDILDDLFDIAQANAMETMKIAEDQAFLKMQRQKGRPGCMIGVDNILYGKEQRLAERLEKEQQRKRTHDGMMKKQQCRLHC